MCPREKSVETKAGKNHPDKKKRGSKLGLKSRLGDDIKKKTTPGGREKRQHVDQTTGKNNPVDNRLWEERHRGKKKKSIPPWGGGFFPWEVSVWKGVVGVESILQGGYEPRMLILRGRGGGGKRKIPPIMGQREGPSGNRGDGKMDQGSHEGGRTRRWEGKE